MNNQLDGEMVILSMEYHSPEGLLSELTMNEEIVQDFHVGRERTYGSAMISELSSIVVSIFPTVFSKLAEFITVYTTAHSNEKIVFDAEKGDKKVHIELPAGMTSEQIANKLTPLKELFETM